MNNIAKNTTPFAWAFSALLMGAVAMAISTVFVRYAEVGPLISAFWRATIALPLLFLWAWYENRKDEAPLLSKLKMDRSVVLAGVFFAGDLIFWHLSIVQTTIANATLLSCLAPVWVLLLSGAFIGEKVGRNAYVGLVLCLLGTAFLIGSSLAIAPERLLGDIYGLITSLFFGLYFLAVRVARRTHSAGALIFMSTLVTSVALFIVALLSDQTFWPQTMVGIGALLALGLFCQSVGQGLLAVALGSLSAAFSSLVIFIEAVAAAFFGWLVFSEALTIPQFLGALLILYGIWVARPKTSANG